MRNAASLNTGENTSPGTNCLRQPPSRLAGIASLEANCDAMINPAGLQTGEIASPEAQQASMCSTDFNGFRAGL